VAAGSLRNEFWQQVEIMGVIRPVVKSILEQNIRNIGIIGTQATIQSNIYPAILGENGRDLNIFQKATPLLAPMIEAGLAGSPEMKEVLSAYLSDEAFDRQEAILLACTHYPLIREAVDDYFNHSKKILDNAGPLAVAVKDFLRERDLLSAQKSAEHEFYVSKYSPHFEKTIQTFYGQKITVTETDLYK
jgi:glutamate racemase